MKELIFKISEPHKSYNLQHVIKYQRYQNTSTVQILENNINA